MSDSIFTNLREERALFETEHFFVIEDGYPVSPGHLLVISKEQKPDFFALSNAELLELPPTILLAKTWIEERHNPDGFNVGMNCGEAAGQTVMHFHCHVIPRYSGDMANPRGGVRGVIPEKQGY
jgi:diadenosine tetraphosphate (Ap4A) HIT family hydrolase